MDSTRSPAINDKPPTSSSEPHPGPRGAPGAPKISGADITAHDTISTGTDGTPHARSGTTDGPKNPYPANPNSGATGTGTEYNTHMKGTGAPGSHSELFGLTPGEGKVHPPPGTGPGSEAIGTSGHQGARNSTLTGTGEEDRKPSLLNRLNPLTDSDGDGKKGVSE